MEPVETMLERPANPKTPVETRYAFDLDDVAPPAPARAEKPRRELTDEDRLALGLASMPHAAHAAPEVRGDAAAALRDILAKGGALGKDARRR